MGTTIKRCDLSRFGAILHEKWSKSEVDEDKIIGCWAEDLSRFEFTVPQQLRDLIVDLQNFGHAHYVRDEYGCPTGHPGAMGEPGDTEAKRPR